MHEAQIIGYVWHNMGFCWYFQLAKYLFWYDGFNIQVFIILNYFSWGKRHWINTISPNIAGFVLRKPSANNN